MIRIARLGRLARAALGSAALALGGAALAQTGGGAYAALDKLPDWSGWWTTDLPFVEAWLASPPPLKPGLLRQVRAARGQDTDPDPLRYCRPPQFAGSSGGFIGAVEFLFTPGRVTLTEEGGLIRRIYTDGTPLPKLVEPTNTGTSVGRWEGQTLVVETIGINPFAAYPAVFQGSMPIGKGVRITERISQKDTNTLQFEVVTEAPDVLTAPDRRTAVYRRSAKRLANEITLCADHDRSIDPATGKQRFDLTPPADLPPPPRR
ncbi:MAG TPA: hypothetical protein VE907_03440 [Gammaproteobacteria bacterium]|nr:hypothetical protein [Gammaproteobacteria bacterium]